MAGLTGKRECHPDDRPHAQPRVTAIVPTQRRDGGQPDTGSGYRSQCQGYRTAHQLTARSVIPALPGAGAAYFVVLTRRYTLTLRGEMSSRAGPCLVKLCFPAVCLSVE